MSNASARRAGTGQALGWFALTGPGYVDEIRIRAGGGDPYREWELARTTVAAIAPKSIDVSSESSLAGSASTVTATACAAADDAVPRTSRSRTPVTSSRRMAARRC